MVAIASSLAETIIARRTRSILDASLRSGGDWLVGAEIIDQGVQINDARRAIGAVAKNRKAISTIREKAIHRHAIGLVRSDGLPVHHDFLDGDTLARRFRNVPAV